MKKTLIMAVVILLVNAYGSIAQQTPKQTSEPKLNITIKGQVLDSLTNETIPYATLKITTEANPAKAVKMMATDDAGKFSTVLDAAGTYLLTIQYVGKSAPAKSFEISKSDKQKDLGKIYMTDNSMLEEVVVTAFKPLVSVDLDKITYRMEDDPDSKTNTVLDMLRKVPLVTVDADDKIQLKGSSSYKIYMDGKPSNLISNNPTQVLRSMPANTVKSIEVITDPGAKYDAEGVTGIINIITNKQPLGGYLVNLNAGVNSMGGYNGGVYSSIKYGKIGFTGNYNYSLYKNPSSPYETYRENYHLDSEKYLHQNGSNRYDSRFQYGYGEFSYEIDTLNLISASFSNYGGTSKSFSNLDVYAQDKNKNTAYQYRQRGVSEDTYGSLNANIDYQRTFKKKDELLTTSYRFSRSPNDSHTNTTIDSIVAFPSSSRIEDNVAGDKEHTMQIDYTTPLSKIHTVEGGVKYIIRLNDSDVDYSSYWNSVIPSSGKDQFRYRYDIYSGYAGYNLRYKTYGFKAGLRFEDTEIKAKYPLASAKNFDKHYFSLVPSGTLTYRFKEVHNLRLGYNLRIQRPGIWYLNPYVNNSDPKYVSSGNPNLDVEKAHNIGLTYSVFKPKITLNTNLNYNFTNNSIQRITRMVNDVSYSTYENIGKESRTGLFVYANWNPTMKLRMYLNGGGFYTDLNTNNGSGLSNKGFSERLFGNAQYTLPKDLRISLNGGWSSPQVMLQGKSSGYHYIALGINKSFLKKKLTVSISGQDLFAKYRTYTSSLTTNDFYSRSKNYYQSRSVNLRVSYQFGEMKQQIKKANRGISNDDSKAGESNSQGGGGSNNN